MPSSFSLYRLGFFSCCCSSYVVPSCRVDVRRNVSVCLSVGLSRIYSIIANSRSFQFSPPVSRFLCDDDVEGVLFYFRVIDAAWFMGTYGCYLLSMLCFLMCFGDGPHWAYSSTVDDAVVLKVGEELREETMPLRGGSRSFKVEGLKPRTRYEVKISYPASIPAHFSLQLRKGGVDFKASFNRKLLNTEKLIFTADGVEYPSNQGGTQVMVSVEPEGVIAIHGVNDRQSIIFNIVCNELVLGIPHKAWWVVVCVLLCLAMASVVPSFLPSFLLPKRPTPGSLLEDYSKRS